MLKESFVIHTEYIEDLPEENKAEYLMYIYKYGSTGEEPNLSGLAQTIWIKIKRRMDYDNQGWETTKAHRSEAGRKGGLKSAEAKRSNIKQSEANPSTLKQNVANSSNDKQSEANEAVYVNEYVNESETENEFVNENVNTQSADARVRKVPDFSELQKNAFNLIQEHNSTARKERKVPISADLWQFSCREMRELLETARKDSPEIILASLANFLKVAKAGDTWVKTFTWRSFCKNYVNYNPDYFTLTRYLTPTEETDDATKKPENVFFFKIKDNPNFHVSTFEKHIADWNAEGRPEGADYFTLQKKWEAQDAIKQAEQNRGEDEKCF